MSYLAAKKLSGKLASLVLVLFSAACFALVMRLFLVRNDFAQLNLYIRDGIQSGSLDLVWWGSNPAWGPQLLMLLDIFVTVGGFVGSVVFFLMQRRKKDN